MTLDYKELRTIVSQLNRVAGFIQFSGLDGADVAMRGILDVISTLDDDITKQIEEILEKHEL